MKGNNGTTGKARKAYHCWYLEIREEMRYLRLKLCNEIEGGLNGKRLVPRELSCVFDW
jgi:hypothetical protein